MSTARAAAKGKGMFRISAAVFYFVFGAGLWAWAGISLAPVWGQVTEVGKTNVSVVAKRSPLPEPPKPMQAQPEPAPPQKRLPLRPQKPARQFFAHPQTAPEEEEPAAEVDSKSEQPSREISLDLPLKFKGFYLGDVTVKMGKGKEVEIKLGSLLGPLGKVLTQETIAKVANGTANVTTVSKSERASSSLSLVRLMSFGSNDGPPEPRDKIATAAGNDRDYLPLSEIKKRGLDLTYEPLASELVLKPTIEQQAERELKFDSHHEEVKSANTQAPALFSAYLNTRMTVGYVSQSTTTDTGLYVPQFDFDGAWRLGPLVLESEASLLPRNAGAASATFGDYDLIRRGSRLVVDQPDAVIRYRAGDISPPFAGFQTSPDMLGISAERSYAQLRPGQNIRPTGQHSFRLERPSSVDILVDGVIYRRLHLQPGNYNINELPLKPGATKVALSIEEDTGARRTLEFTNFGGQELLAAGIDEWQIAGGVYSDRAAHRVLIPSLGSFGYIEPDYLWSEPALTAFYKRGLSSYLTAGLNVQGDRHGGIGGASLSTQTPYGYVALELAGSITDYGASGFAARMAYELLNISDGLGRPQSFRLSAEYRSPAFYSLGGLPALPSENGVILAAAYSREFTEDLGAAITGDMILSRDLPFALNKWDVDLTLSQRFTTSFSGSISAGYGEGGSVFHQEVPCNCYSLADYGGFRAFVRLSYRPSVYSSLSADYDGRAQGGRLTYIRSSGAGVGAYNLLVDAAGDATRQAAGVNASAEYSGNRGDISIAHSSRIEGLAMTGFQPYSAEERTTLRIESSLVTAGGAIAIGRPVHNSFAIVEGHESLGSRGITLGSGDAKTGHSDWILPAIVPDINPYTQKRIEFDVDDLPAGYDLGAGAFDFYGPYKVGYRVTAGSAYTVTAIGTLIGHDGKPLSLISGSAREAGKDGGREVQIFTNKAGRFGAQGLSSGRWIIEMGTEHHRAQFVLDVPPGTMGLFNAGALTPN